MRVRHGLQRGEGFRGDDEKRFLGIEIDHRLDEVRAVDVGDEAECQRAVAVVFQRLVSHHRPKVGAADADIDHVLDALARVALPSAGANARRKFGHLVEHGVHLRHDVLAVHRDRRAFRRTKRDMQNGAVFGDVDLLAAEHGVDARAKPDWFARSTSSFSVSPVTRFFE